MDSGFRLELCGRRLGRLQPTGEPHAGETCQIADRRQTFILSVRRHSKGFATWRLKSFTGTGAAPVVPVQVKYFFKTGSDARERCKTKTSEEEK